MPARIALAALVLAAIVVPAAADGVPGRDSASRRCGGDAFTFAQVTEGRGRAARGEPIVSVPDTLCADLEDDRRTRVDSIQVVIDPRQRDDRPLGGESARRGR